jgi:spore germination protein KB
MQPAKLSVMQLSLLMYNAIVATALLVVPADMARKAGADMWFAPLWALPAGLLSVYTAYRLHTYYPGKTPIEYFPDILGEVLGKWMGFFYVVFHLIMAALVVREYAEFIVGPFLDRTPLILIIASVLLVSGYAVYSGVSVMARIGVLFAIPLVALTVINIFLLYPVMETRNALPILEYGVWPSMSASVVAQGWLAEFWIIAYLIPYLPRNSKPLKWLFGSVCWVIITLMVVNATSLFVFGVLTGHMDYPFFVANRFISYANFFEHVEAAAMTVWVAALVSKLSVFYYIAVLNIAKWTHMSDYRPLVIPIGGVILTTGIFISPNQQWFNFLLSHYSPTVFLLFLLILPLFFWLIAAIRHSRTKKKETAL